MVHQAVLLFAIFGSAFSLRFSHLSECGKSRGCWLLPAGCSSDCQAIITWQHQGKAILFDIESKVKKNGIHGMWMGVGISRDDRMGNDTVVECHFPPSNIPGSVHLSHNIQNSNLLLPHATDFLLKDAFTEISEGKSWCGAEWILDVTVLTQDEKSMLHKINNGRYTLFFAYGELNAAGEKLPHGTSGAEAPWKSAESVRFCYSCPNSFQIVDEHLVKKKV